MEYLMINKKYKERILRVAVLPWHWIYDVVGGIIKNRVSLACNSIDEVRVLVVEYE